MGVTLFDLWHQHRVTVVIVALLGACLVQICLLVARKHTEQPTVQLGEKPAFYITPASVTETKKRPVTNSGPRRIVGQKRARKPAIAIGNTEINSVSVQPLVFFSSLNGSTKSHAQSLAETLQCPKSTRTPSVLDISYIDLDDYFTALPKTDPDEPGDVRYFYLILLPTYDIDTNLSNFLEHLRETHHDFRIDTAPLSGLAGYSVFGFGDKEGWPSEQDGYCSQAKEVDRWMAKLTAMKRAYPLGMGDVKTDATARLRDWKQGVETVIAAIASGQSLGEGVVGSGEAMESDEEDSFEGQSKKSSKKKSDLRDLETLGSMAKSNPIPIDITTTGSLTARKEMVPKSSPTYAALTKQGYTIVGSHSGVKICRWTKSALRGRGSCYKYSMYGINSHLCMEATPSLSCSNKCVFCWRHGTNPVSTTWRWQVDPPDMVFAGIKAGHYQKIKMMRGVPGVRAERFEEAMRVRHCALSLVGEPIFYPHINELTGMLHGERISTFLVCNAQHPDELAALKPVTQLYVSIDASNRESLRKVDRPLHRDFWERFCRCLDIVREKQFRQRTVFRLTLVKGFNVEDEVEGYADLVARGLPCFVEVKGVTYCGTSTAAGAGLTMQNVPFYEEVAEFVVALNAALAKRGLAYGIAAEHAHSCCVLLASERFRRGGRWHTVIDYARFFHLLERGGNFAPEEFMAPTEEWALWGNGGFDPRDERVKRKGANKVKEIDVKQAS